MVERKEIRRYDLQGLCSSGRCLSGNFNFNCENIVLSVNFGNIR